MVVGDAHVFPSFLTAVLTLLIIAKPPTTFLTCFCRGERRKYAGKKVRLNRGSNSQPPGHESDTLTTEPPGRGLPYVQILLLLHRSDYPFPKQTLVFMCLRYRSFENAVGKGEIARNEQFLPFPTVFPGELPTIFIK